MSSKPLVQIVNEDDGYLGVTDREKVINNPNMIHRTVELMIINEKKQLLLSQRSQSKVFEPGQYKIAISTFIEEGEEPIESCARVMEKELGVKPIPVQFLLKLYDKNDHEVKYIHYYFCHYFLDDFKPNHEEIEHIAWVDISEAEDFIKKHKDNMSRTDKLIVDHLQTIM
ncbi:MAG: NUDIX domain-containing protein [Candidatus Dojkabacteria bacterium]|nr:NUDIX domain-containing protein [Candidatus Dojkabacteria bacterium]MDQ7021820.1 NUDIX domain-containing protein [Candidatus Dojkabacteria bacterium]